ncbi:MAG: (Na+)-NQR maturation NqrM [Halieaceae bacterium]|nr:(Na+)-NQR maturation NqrM [Halieaceae bacterium]
METFVLAFILMGVVVAIMAVGVIFGRQPIKGSCGGMGAVGIDTACELCGGDPNKCETESEKAATQTRFGSFYSADKN